MSSEFDKQKKDLFMAELRKQFGARLAQLVPKKKISEFALLKGLAGIRLDRVVQGKKAVDLFTLFDICQKLGASPTWLLFGKGPQLLEDVEKNFIAATLLQSSKSILTTEETNVDEATRLIRRMGEAVLRTEGDASSKKSSVSKKNPSSISTSRIPRDRRTGNKRKG